jgi:hypothetical protein
MEEKMKKEKVLYVKVDKEMHEKMKEVAQQKDVRMTDIIRILLSHFLSGKIKIEDEFFSIRSERFKKLNCSYCGKEFWKYIKTIHSRQKIFSVQENVISNIRKRITELLKIVLYAVKNSLSFYQIIKPE